MAKGPKFADIKRRLIKCQIGDKIITGCGSGEQVAVVAECIEVLKY
jgi:hypothetical protein